MRRMLLKALVAGIALLGLSAGNAVAQSNPEVNWRYFGVIPTANKFGAKLDEMFGRIAERTDGKFQIEYVYFAETPYKFTDALNLMNQGLVNAVEFLPGYFTSTYPILAAPELPYLAPEKPNPAQAQAAGDRAWASGPMRAELDKIEAANNAVEILSFYYPPMNYWFKPKVTTIEDFEGLRVRDFAKESMTLWELMGATPVSMDGSEIYTALQRGALDGLVTGSTSMMGQKWGEVLTSGFITNFKLARTTMVVNKDDYEALPEAYRQVLNEEAARTAEEIRGFMVENEAKELAMIEEKLDFTITQASPEQYGALREKAKNQVWPSWVERTGGNAQEVLTGILAASGDQ